MARALVLGNGTSLVALDKYGFVRDVHFHYVGLENHVSGHKHRIGVMINNQFSWLDDGSWQISIGYKPGTMVGYLVCKSEHLQVSLVMEDIVYNETNVFLRQVDVYNHSKENIDIKLFFHQVFMIYESKKRNTAFYDPTHNAVVHYKGRRVFVVNARTAKGQVLDDYAVGAYQFEGKAGTYKDAEDGQLGKNAVEHGSVDSVIRVCTACESQAKARVFYWICIGKSLEAAYELNEMVNTKTPEGMIHSTEYFWHAWLNQRPDSIKNLPAAQQKLFDMSLFILRAHTDNRGSIIASADSAMIEYGKDDYAYMWPRDAAFITTALDHAGFNEITKPFFKFCQQVLHPDGYLHHRFNSDQSLGSTWHSTTAQKSWLKDKILQLPIQEDETAGVLFALWQHYQASKDLEFIEELYKPMIEKMAQFLVNFRNQQTGLPLPSYDLWEEKIGVSTYTCAAVYGGLTAAADFSELLGKRNHMRAYKQAAEEIKEAMLEQLFSDKLQSFVRYATTTDNQVKLHEVIDASSLFGLWYFGALSQDHPKFQATQAAVAKHLNNPGPVGGIIRYQGDYYFKDTDLANPWFITTMWEGLRMLHHPQVGQAQLRDVEAIMDWVLQHRYASGILAEQLNPYTGESRSATPLVWSHAVWVELVLKYLAVKEQLTQPQQG
ncbi:MAG: glycoside hydrolase family 15 protein [Candidatus Pacebacteria bacterium]|nr:glycoside hydrolase family 15 protein [Candidatus Paceibacterota bacterium]